MDTLGEEILNIIKGANMKLKMFTAEGQKTERRRSNKILCI